MTNATNDILRSIENGHTTSNDISDATGLNPGAVRKYLAKLHDDGQIVRSRNGRSYDYALKPTASHDASAELDSVNWAETLTPDNESLVTDRTYDWSRHIPAEGTEFVAPDGSYEYVEQLIDFRHETGSAMRFYLTGPPGTGKTTFPKAIASKNQWPMFTVQGTYSMYDADLIGSPIQVGDDTVWVDATVTKALLSAQHQPTILVIDEINRTRPEALSVFYSVLDHRAEVGIPIREGEVVRARPDNLIVFATANVGREYQGTQKLDPAMERRLGRRIEIDHLGVHDPDAEASFICERAPVTREFATKIVRACNDVRRLAADDDSQSISRGIPVSMAVEWARDAYVSARVGNDRPAMKAADMTIVSLLYGENPDAASEVRNVIDMRVGDANPLPASESTESDDDDGESTESDDDDGEWGDQSLSCVECERQFSATRAADLDLFATFDCPECDGDLIPLDE